MLWEDKNWNESNVSGSFQACYVRFFSFLMMIVLNLVFWNNLTNLDDVETWYWREKQMYVKKMGFESLFKLL